MTLHSVENDAVYAITTELAAAGKGILVEAYMITFFVKALSARLRDRQGVYLATQLKVSQEISKFAIPTHARLYFSNSCFRGDILTRVRRIIEF